MKALTTTLFLIFCIVFEGTGQKQPVDYVDPFMGTSNARWMIFPGPSMPFGMVKLSPDNQKAGWKAGYEYYINNIAGFSHIHEWTMAGLLIMPAMGKLEIEPGRRDNPDGGYRSRFKHENESASPGYYSVLLDDHNIKAELTSTTRAGFMQFTYPKSTESRIIVDLKIDSEYGYEIFGANIKKISDTEIEGYCYQQALKKANYNEYIVNFVIRFNKPFKSMGGWNYDGIQQNIESIFSGWDDTDFGVFLNFDTEEGELIKVQTGVSLVSIEQARLNLDTEMKPFGWDFNACHQNARNTWNDLLCKIQVETKNEVEKKKFYTNMYRSYVGRTILSDVNGKYVDMCEKEQQVDPESPMLSSDAFWNTFWNLNQLWTLVTPDVAEKWVKSQLEMYDKGGWLSNGPVGIEYSSIMVASHEIPLMVSAYQKGIRGYDVNKAWEAIKHEQMTPGTAHLCGGRVGNIELAPYMHYGYVPFEDGPVSNTMEYGYDDYTVSQFAKALGKDEDYKYFLNRSMSYINMWDPSVGYMNQRKRDGSFVPGFSPFCCSTFWGPGGWVEGNAWQYTFFVPHDLQGIINLMGKDEFNSRLTAGFEKSREWKFNSETTVPENGLEAMGVLPINHGNQPNMQAAYLFNYSGKPWLTQYYVREIMNLYYGTKPETAWPGDEDQGQMGAWYVMSALGLFEMEGGCAVKPWYEIGTPVFDKAVIQLDPKYYPGGKITITTKNNSDQNRYIQSAKLNDKPLNKLWIYHEDLVKGATLEFEMGPKPNKKWGTATDAVPPSISVPK